MTIALRYAARSDVGLLREGNEDSAYASGRLLAVADGMGGHAHGEVASSVAIAAMASLEEGAYGNDLLGAIEAAVRDANRRLHEMVGRDPSLKGMGTTLTAMLWNGTQVALVHVGDSRAYMLRRGELYQITHDHTLVQSLVDDGRITPEEAATHPQRSILLRALDGSGEVDPDLTLREAQVDDRYLLCSDGLSGVVSPEVLHNTLTTVDEPEDVVRALIDLANKGGGPDNITCVVADVVEVEDGVTLPCDAAVVGAAGNNRNFPLITPPQQRTTITAPQPVITDDGLGAPAAQAVQDSPKRRRRWWPLLTTAFGAVVALVGAGAYFGYQWTQEQFFIGAQGDEIVVYRGIDAQLGPLQFFEVARATGHSLSALDAFQQGRVRDGIIVTSVDEGLQKIDELRASASPSPTAARQSDKTADRRDDKAGNRNSSREDATGEETSSRESKPSQRTADSEEPRATRSPE